MEIANAEISPRKSGNGSKEGKGSEFTHEQRQLTLLTEDNMTWLQRKLLFQWNWFVLRYRWAIIGIILAWCILAFINVMKLGSNSLLPYLNHLSNTYPV